MAFEGPPEEIAKNFLNHAMTPLEKVLLKTSTNEEKDIQESLYCFEQGLEAKCTDDKLNFDLYMGRAKLNILRA